MHRLQFCRAKPPKGLVLTTELQRNYMCGALLGLPECKSIANYYCPLKLFDSTKN